MTDSAPEGSLTENQLEILEVVWERDDGATVAEIWHELESTRDIGRTTVLTLVQRLEKRGWLARIDGGRAARFRATVSREDANQQLASEFVDTFFGGSPSSLVQSLLGDRKLPAAELRRLRELVDRKKTKKNPGNAKGGRS